MLYGDGIDGFPDVYQSPAHIIFLCKQQTCVAHPSFIAIKPIIIPRVSVCPYAVLFGKSLPKTSGISLILLFINIILLSFSHILALF